MTSLIDANMIQNMPRVESAKTVKSWIFFYEEFFKNQINGKENLFSGIVIRQGTIEQFLCIFSIEISVFILYIQITRLARIFYQSIVPIRINSIN